MKAAEYITRTARNLNMVGAIKRECARAYRVRLFEISSRSHRPRVVAARRLAGYFMREIVGMSWPDIAHELGHKDHVTLMRAHRRIEQDMESCPELRQMLAQVRARLIVVEETTTRCAWPRCWRTSERDGGQSLSDALWLCNGHLERYYQDKRAREHLNAAWGHVGGKAKQ